MTYTDVSEEKANNAVTAFVNLAAKLETAIYRRMALRRLLLSDASMSSESSSIADIAHDVSPSTVRVAAASQIRRAKEEFDHNIFISKIMQLDGIGPVLAERLYNEFGSLPALANATPERLLLVKGIGESRLHTITDEVKTLL